MMQNQEVFKGLFITAGLGQLYEFCW